MVEKQRRYESWGDVPERGYERPFEREYEYGRYETPERDVLSEREIGARGGFAGVTGEPARRRIVDEERLEELRRASLVGIDRTELGAAGIAILLGLFTLAGLMHLLTALGVTAGAAGYTQLVGAIPGLETLLAYVGGYSVVALVLAVVDFVAAWGLWNLRSWSWGLAIVAAILGFFILPFGPIGSVLILVYLLQEEVRTPFRTLSRAKESRRTFRRHARGA